MWGRTAQYYGIMKVVVPSFILINLITQLVDLQLKKHLMQNYSQLPFVVHIAARSKNRYPRILQNEYAVFKLKCKICIIQKSLPQWECKNEDNCGQPSTSQDKIHSISCNVGREHIQTGGRSSWI